MNNAFITDIQRASFHDGAGVRTTVFFKGCSLNCAWCHNPECIAFDEQVLYYPEKCIGCGKCEQGCYAGAKVICGKSMTDDEILAEIMQDKPYYCADGGVTFSGGEPLAQRDALLRLMKLCKAQGISVAIETSLVYFDAEIFSLCDFVMADFKIFDSEVHKKYTGVGNERIKEHFKKLDELSIPIIVRTPVIPEIEQGIEQISEFAKSLKNVTKYELLAYHPLGNSKRKALGLPNDGFTVPSKEQMNEVNKYAFIRR